MRLTRKTNIGYLEEPIGDGEIYTHDQKLTNIDNIIQKLGQIEDIMEKYGINSTEELEHIILNDATGEQAFRDYIKPYKDIENKLGIDLVTLFKALDKKQRIFVLNEYDMRVVELPVRYASRKLVDGEIFINVSGCFANFKIKDYGKWWALTKEELEHE